MPKIDEIDPNFRIAGAIEKSDVRLYDCLEKPFRVYGLMPPSTDEKRFLRMPQATAASVNEGVADLNQNTAGGRLKFRTDSSYAAIRAVMPTVARMAHFALSGSSGFDLYCRDREHREKERYFGTFMPPYDMKDGYAAVVDFGSREEREITIHFPLYSAVQSLEIGLQEDASLLPAGEYLFPVPVVYYGSSITQGGCASRPGNAYQNIISRELNCDHVNLGFSGSAKGEIEMADYIASLKMSVFVCDYDYNAPTPEYLRKTHGPFFRRIRQKQPELPVVLVSNPSVWPTEEQKERREIIRQTYLQAIDSGDRRVSFVDGSEAMRRCGNDGGTVDGCHPNDLGFLCMAQAIGEAVRKALREKMP